MRAPPARFSGKNAKGHVGSYAFLLTERPTRTPMDRARLGRYDSSYRVLRVARHAPEGDEPLSCGRYFGASSRCSARLLGPCTTGGPPSSG